jgi:SPP1 gp7 family putative phage head morphogenesis protein
MPDPTTEQSMAAQGLGPVMPFSPGRPINPYLALGTAPRAYDFRTGRNINVRPRSDRSSFDLLAGLTYNWPVAAMCIAHRINSYKSFTWSVVPMPGETGNNDLLIQEATKIMQRPDGKHSYMWVISQYLEDLFRYDAACLYRRRDELGRVIGLNVVSGLTIAPMLDFYGRIPDAPAPAYIQYANGLPFEWFTEDDIVYEPLNPQPDSAYGKAPIENVMMAANTDIRMGLSLLDYFTEGSIPGGIVNASASITDPAALREREADWDADLEGDQAKKQRAKWLMADEKFTAIDKKPFDENAFLWNFRIGCAAFGVVPQDLGITLDVNRATSDTQIDIQERISDRPLGLHLDGIFTRYLQDDRGYPVEFHTSLAAVKEDRLTEANAWKVYVDEGVASVSEMRQALLGLPEDDERPVPRFIMTARGGPIPIANLMAIAGPVNPDTMMPAEEIPLLDTQDKPLEAAAGLLPGKTMNTPGALVSTFNPDEPEFPQDENAVPPAPTMIAAVAKAETAGITTETGLEGVDLQGRDEDEEEEAEVAKELSRWRDNARGRVKLGKAPRQFASTILPVPLWTAVWKTLEPARTRNQVDQAFEVAKAQGPKAPRRLLDQIAAHYAPLIQAALPKALGGLDDAIRAYAQTQSVVKALQADPAARQAARVALAAAVVVDPSALKTVLQNLAADAYLAGTHTAASTGQVLTAFGKIDTAIDWDAWTPGSAAAAQALNDPGLNAVLDAADQTISGLTSNTIDQIGTVLADGISQGTSVDALGVQIRDFVGGDADRAFMIANTETCRAMSQASMNTYTQNGITGVTWSGEDDACDICQANIDAGIIATGDDFPSGDSEPPAHPNDRCSVSPADLPTETSQPDQSGDEE